MTEYHKINAPFKRYPKGHEHQGQFIFGEWALEEFDYLQKNKWLWTEKVDGTNIRVTIHKMGDVLDVKYQGRTDAAVIPEPLLEHLEQLFPIFPSWRRLLSSHHDGARYDRVSNWMIENDLEKVTLYGEGYGPKIQGGGKYAATHRFVLFDVKVNDFWLLRDAVNDVAEKLLIDAVPVFGEYSLQRAMHLAAEGIKSEWGDFEAEGLVGTPVVPLRTRRGDRIITKVKGVDFKDFK